MSFRMFAATLLVLALSIQSAFSGTMPVPGETAQKRLRVGLSLPTLEQERWVRDLDNMVAQAKDMGIELIVQLTMSDQYQQNLNIEQLVTLGVDVLIIAPHDSFGAEKIVELAHNANMKVISYDRLIFNSDIDLYVSYDNFAVGRMQGGFLARHVPKGNYIILGGPQYDSNARFYKEGAMMELRERIDRGDITVILDEDVFNWDMNTTKELVETILGMHLNDVAAVLAPNDGMAAGAIAALKQHGMQGVVVTGQDADAMALERVMGGSQAMTVFKDISEEVKAALHAAVFLSEGGDVTQLTKGRTVNNLKHNVPSILLEPVLIEKFNLNEVLLGAGHIQQPVQAEE